MFSLFSSSIFFRLVISSLAGCYSPCCRSRTNWLKPTVAIVDECYPSECIKFRSLLSPKQSRFRVSGESIESNKPPPIESRSCDSLQVKPVRSKVDSTPTPEPPTTPTFDQRTSGLPNNERMRDSLDDIIDEARAIRDLVRLSSSVYIRNLQVSSMLTEWTAFGPTARFR